MRHTQPGCAGKLPFFQTVSVPVIGVAVVCQKVIATPDTKSGEVPVCIIGIFLRERSMDFSLDGSVRMIDVFPQLVPVIPQ